MDDIAIYFQKIDLGDYRWLFKPITVIRGSFDFESEEFVTDCGIVCDLISGRELDSEDYFFCPTTMERLRKKYGEENLEEVLLTEYLNEYMSFCYIGYYNNSSDRIQILKISLDELEYKEETVHERENILNDEVDYMNIPLDTLSKLGYSTNLEDSSKLKDITDNNFSNNVFSSGIEEITPYSILGLEDGDYSKEELLIAVKNSIEYIKSLGRGEQADKNEIDCILDAYNEIVTPWQEKKEFYKKL